MTTQGYSTGSGTQYKGYKEYTSWSDGGSGTYMILYASCDPRTKSPDPVALCAKTPFRSLGLQQSFEQALKQPDDKRGR